MKTFIHLGIPDLNNLNAGFIKSDSISHQVIQYVTTKFPIFLFQSTNPLVI